MSDEGDRSFHCEIKWIKFLVFTGFHLRAELLVPLTVHLAHTCLPFQGKSNLEKSSMVTAWSYWSEPPVHNTEQNVCNAHTKECRTRPTRASLKLAHWGEKLIRNRWMGEMEPVLESEWGDVLHCRWNLFLQTKMENQTISSKSDNCEERGTSPGVKCEFFWKEKFEETEIFEEKILSGNGELTWSQVWREVTSLLFPEYGW